MDINSKLFFRFWFDARDKTDVRYSLSKGVTMHLSNGQTEPTTARVTRNNHSAMLTVPTRRLNGRMEVMIVQVTNRTIIVVRMVILLELMD